MDWYYAERDQLRGPLREDEFLNLVHCGRISSTTLVWHEGMSDWQPYGQVNSEETLTIATYHPVESDNDNLERNSDEVNQSISDHGVLTRGTVEYGGFWIRFAAKFLDGVALWVVNAGFTFLMAMLFESLRLSEYGGIDSFSFIMLQVTKILVQIVTGLFYTTWFVGRFGATPGKMVCNLKVITAEGGQVSYLRAFCRYWSEMLSGFLLMIGYIMAGFDEEKRTLHDRIVNTRVIMI